MITIYNPQDQSEVIETLENVDDYRELLNKNQWMALLPADVKKTIAVLGTAHASGQKVYWRRNDNTSVYTDYVITIK